MAGNTSIDYPFPLVQMEDGGYLWSLGGDNDPTGFWDRFLDGMTEQPMDRLDNIRIAHVQAKAWLNHRILDCSETQKSVASTD